MADRAEVGAHVSPPPRDDGAVRAPTVSLPKGGGAIGGIGEKFRRQSCHRHRLDVGARRHQRGPLALRPPTVIQLRPGCGQWSLRVWLVAKLDQLQNREVAATIRRCLRLQRVHIVGCGGYDADLLAGRRWNVGCRPSRVHTRFQRHLGAQTRRSPWRLSRTISRTTAAAPTARPRRRHFASTGRRTNCAPNLKLGPIIQIVRWRNAHATRQPRRRPSGTARLGTEDGRTEVAAG